MINDSGEQVAEAPPSMPVQVLGLTSVPGAGDNFLVVEDDRMARQIAEKREARQRAAMLAKTTRRKTLDQLFEQLAKGETQELRLILKGDSAGAVEEMCIRDRRVADRPCRRRPAGSSPGRRTWAVRHTEVGVGILRP